MPPLVKMCGRRVDTIGRRPIRRPRSRDALPKTAPRIESGNPGRRGDETAPAQVEDPHALSAYHEPGPRVWKTLVQNYLAANVTNGLTSNPSGRIVVLESAGIPSTRAMNRQAT